MDHASDSLVTARDISSLTNHAKKVSTSVRSLIHAVHWDVGDSCPCCARAGAEVGFSQRGQQHPQVAIGYPLCGNNVLAGMWACEKPSDDGNIALLCSAQNHVPSKTKGRKDPICALVTP